MSSSNRRVPMFIKFWLGCTLLAALLITGGFLVVRSETKMKSRGDYLAKHFKRYLEYQEGLGQAVSSIADVLATDPLLVDALKRGAPTTDAEGNAVPTGPTASEVATQMYKRLSAKNALRPDVFVVFDRNKLVWSNEGSGVDEEHLREMEPVVRVRSGQAFFNKVLIQEGNAIQLAGVPIHDGKGAILGGMMLGVDVTRYLQQYMEQSDNKPRMQHRLSLVHDGKVVASVMPKDLWPELQKQLKKENWKEVQEGEDMRQYIDMKADDFDFTSQEVEGFAGLDAGPVATLYLMRSRSNLKGRGPKIPWTEMMIGAVLSLGVAILLALWITKPIKHFVTQSQLMLEGGADLHQRIEINSRDETADLADNINRVFARLYGLASEVQSAAFQVGASSAEISAASKNMLGGLKDQTFKIESSTAAVTELSASIQQVASNAMEATKVAEKSNDAVTLAVERMQQIRSSVIDASNKMAELGDSSKRIGNIVEVIRQISEQTSLLALNASIEAAHAGEQGRGFAVVADEVSSLARRVGQSAKDIESLIQTVKEQTSDAIASMEIGSSEVENGTMLVTNTLQDLGVLIATVNDTAAAVQEQAEVSDEIARNMDAVQQIATELVDGSAEAVQQGEQLHSLAYELERSVGGFNLEANSSQDLDRPALPHNSEA